MARLSSSNFGQLGGESVDRISLSLCLSNKTKINLKIVNIHVFHLGAPRSFSRLWPLTLAFCQCRPCEAAGMIQVIVFLYPCGKPGFYFWLPALALAQLQILWIFGCESEDGRAVCVPFLLSLSLSLPLK